MNERYIEINGNPTTMPLPVGATPQEISEFIRDYLRYKGDFAFNLVPVENDSIYPDGEYSEIRIVIKNTNEEPDESEDEEFVGQGPAVQESEYYLWDYEYPDESEDEEFVGQAAQVSEHYQGEY